MQDSKKCLLLFRHKDLLSQDQCPKIEKDHMKVIPYVSTMGYPIYVMLCSRPNICFDIGMVSRTKVLNDVSKYILMYRMRTRNDMFIYDCNESVPFGTQIQIYKHSCKFTFGFVSTLGSGTISWRNVKLSCIVDSTMEVEVFNGFSTLFDVLIFG